MSPATGGVGRSAGPVLSVSSMAKILITVNGSDLRPAYTIGTDPSNRFVMVWQRVKARIVRLLRNAAPEILPAHESTLRFPYDIMEMIIAHLAHDLGALKACSLTCYSWYTAAAPQLHRVLTLRNDARDENRCGLKPLSRLGRLGLAPVVAEIRVSGRWPGSGTWFVPQAFSHHDLFYFSAFANIQILNLEAPEVHQFIPDIERYFGHLSPTLRSIRLWNPCCTPRQLSYFLSLLSNLDDVNIGIPNKPTDTTISDAELIPFSAPKLRGRLVLRDFEWVETWADLIASCGGLRFHYVDLHRVEGCAPVLLRACAGTLETLRWSLCK